MSESTARAAPSVSAAFMSFLSKNGIDFIKSSYRGWNQPELCAPGRYAEGISSVGSHRGDHSRPVLKAKLMC
jgi:hypothetical protein